MKSSRHADLKFGVGVLFVSAATLVQQLTYPERSAADSEVLNNCQTACNGEGYDSQCEVGDPYSGGGGLCDFIPYDTCMAYCIHEGCGFAYNEDYCDHNGEEWAICSRETHEEFWALQQLFCS